MIAVDSRLRATTALLEDTLFLNVPARLAKKLLELADVYGTETERGTRIELRLPQELLGNLVGTSRVSVNQQLVGWRERGWVEVESSFVTVLDAQALARVADGEEESGATAVK